jgi:hypothetical protein
MSRSIDNTLGWRRFEAPAPNEWWQVDVIDWVTAVDGLVKAFNFLDDHSRVACRCRAVAEATSEEAWTTFCEAAQVGAACWGAVGQLAVLFGQAARLRGGLRGQAA